MPILQALGQPFLTRSNPEHNPDAIARSSGSYKVQTGAAYFTFDRKEISLGTGMVMPAGLRTVKVRFKYSLDWNTTAICIPGPGYASAFAEVDCTVFRAFTDSSGAVVQLPSQSVTTLLNQSIAPFLWVNTKSDHTIMNTAMRFDLPEPTREGEAWQFVFSARSECGSGGPFVMSYAWILGTFYLVVVETDD